MIFRSHIRNLVFKCLVFAFVAISLLCHSGNAFAFGNANGNGSSNGSSNGSASQRNKINAYDIPTQPLVLYDFGGEIGFETNLYREKQSRDGGDTVKFKQRSFEEYVLLRTRGYVYHPLFLDFSAEIKLGLMQQSYKRSGSGEDEDESSSENIAGYNIYLAFLKEHPLSINAFATKDRRPLLQLYTDLYMMDEETYGMSFHWKEAPLPTSLSFGRNYFKEWGFDSQSETTIDYVELLVRHNIGKRVRSELRYRYEDYTQDFKSVNTDYEYDRHTHLKSNDISFLNTIYLDDSMRSFLTSQIRYFDQTGTQDARTFNWYERLLLQHTDTLRSYYLLNYNRNEYSDSTVDTYNAEAGIDHQLYLSLDSHLDVHWRRTEWVDVTEDIYGSTGRLGYRKRTGWGYLSAGYAVTVDQYNRTGDSGTRKIIDEPVVLTVAFPTPLSQPNVDLETIRVTDTSGNVTYIPGFDYYVEQRGELTTLRKAAGGQIIDGATVYVDYESDIDNNLEYISLDQNFNIRHDFDKIIPNLALYYSWHDLSNYDAPDDAQILEFTRQVAGFSYDWKELTWSEEFEHYDSNYSTYKQLRSQIEGNHRIWKKLYAGWNVGYLKIKYDDDIDEPQDDYTDVFYSSLGLNGRISNNGFWDLRAQYRDEKGRTEGTLLGLLCKVGYQWRKVRVEAGAKLENREQWSTKRDRMQLYLTVAREF